MSVSRPGSPQQPLLPVSIEHSLNDLGVRIVGGALVAFAATSWLALTLLFGFYLTQVTSYEKTYGALGAVIAFLTSLRAPAGVPQPTDAGTAGNLAMAR